MKFFFKCAVFVLLLSAFTVQIKAQADEFCAESGNSPTMDSPFSRIPYVFGRISIKGLLSNEKFPNVTIFLSGGQERAERLSISRTGNYCFRVKSTGGTLIIEVNGMEVTRRALPAINGQFREDFEIQAGETNKTAPPGVISVKYSRPPNPATVELYKKAFEAEATGGQKELIETLKQIVAIDAEDFVAWAKLGSIYQEKRSYKEAIAAFTKSLEGRIDYIPAWINVGMIRIAEKQYEAAIAVLLQAAEFDPTSARIYQLLGEAYLQSRQGTLGAEALNKAIELDPVGMAEIHLQLAHLYQLAGVNKLAAAEYKHFLSKVPAHPDKKKFEAFIKKNPE